MSIEVVKINTFRINPEEFKVDVWASNGCHAIFVDYLGNDVLFLWKDGTIHHNSTGWIKAGRPDEHSLAPGFWKTEREAAIFLAGWRSLTQAAVIVIKRRQRSEVRWGACAPCEEQNKVEPYVFQSGDVVEMGDYRRIIIEIKGELHAVTADSGKYRGTGQIIFESNHYKKIGVLKDFVESGTGLCLTGI